MKPYLSQLKAVNAAIKATRGIISMPTGSGKSYVIKLIIEKLKLKTLIVVPTLEIKKQMKDILKNLNNVQIENIDSKALLTAKDFDVLIIDEGHHTAAKTYQRLNKTIWTGIYYRFFFTATPFRNNDEETLLFEAICGQVIYQLTYQEAVKAGYIVPIEAYYIDCQKINTDAFTYREVYDALVVDNEQRNLILAILMARLRDFSTLVLVREVAHGAILSNMTGFPFVSGQDEESRDYITLFNRQEVNVLIGTTGVLGEGVDTKPCEYVIIASPGKAKSQFMQQIGRAVRAFKNKESAKIIIFRDSSHKYLLKHYRAQCKILKEVYGVTPVRINL